MNDIPHGETNGYQVPAGARAQMFDLTPHEFILLKALLEHRHLTRDQAISILWSGLDCGPESAEGNLKILVHQLRKKLDGVCISSIHTIQGSGWYFGEKQQKPYVAEFAWQDIQLKMLPVGGTLIGDLGEAHLTATEVTIMKKLLIAKGNYMSLGPAIKGPYVRITHLRKKMSEVSSAMQIDQARRQSYRLIDTSIVV